MNLFFDTSVLVAACVRSHPHHVQAFEAMSGVDGKAARGWISQHSIAELYAVLTSAPLTPRIHPAEAKRIIEENILPRFEVVALEPADYISVVGEVAAAGWRSGRIYDALLLRCAIKAGIDRLYTFNLKDFRALAGSEWQDRICTP